ncbi:hypothetical protein AVEN_87389-1 [Araneus ventricosus]|uniref:Uncharacterized protein n=1 Tax=Araneus ventricosus TaxID=182803 RepID=A0A4Y2IEI3_ARAVE|nr:hypothetical protein AVEN_87389-1 [Araneus ventricosus]
MPAPMLIETGMLSHERVSLTFTPARGDGFCCFFPPLANPTLLADSLSPLSSTDPSEVISLHFPISLHLATPSVSKNEIENAGAGAVGFLLTSGQSRAKRGLQEEGVAALMEGVPPGALGGAEGRRSIEQANYLIKNS